MVLTILKTISQLGVLFPYIMEKCLKAPTSTINYIHVYSPLVDGYNPIPEIKKDPGR